jgi:hypothetical protein
MNTPNQGSEWGWKEQFLSRSGAVGRESLKGRDYVMCYHTAWVFPICCLLWFSRVVRGVAAGGWSSWEGKNPVCRRLLQEWRPVERNAYVSEKFGSWKLFFCGWGETMSPNCGHQRTHCSSPDIWVWSPGGMILTGETRRTRRKTCPCATLSATNPS